VSAMEVNELRGLSRCTVRLNTGFSPVKLEQTWSRSNVLASQLAQLIVRCLTFITLPAEVAGR
jgi:hypothetical protein